MEQTLWHAFCVLGQIIEFGLALAQLVTVGSLVVVLVGVPLVYLVAFFVSWFVPFE